MQNVGELICSSTTTNCVICAQAKMTRKSFKKDCERATCPYQIINYDLMGPISLNTFLENRKCLYFICVIDNFTCYLQVFHLKSKTETVMYMNEALTSLQTEVPGLGQFNKLRSDSGSEFINHVLICRYCTDG